MSKHRQEVIVEIAPDAPEKTAKAGRARQVQPELLEKALRMSQHSQAWVEARIELLRKQRDKLEADRHRIANKLIEVAAELHKLEVQS